MAKKKELTDEKTYGAVVPPVNDPKLWISTGSMALDAAIGRGFPKYRITQIYGPSQSRKTTLLLSMLAEAMKDPVNRACYYSSEPGGFLEELAVMFGIDLNEMRFGEIDTIEDFFRRQSKFCRKAVEDKVEPVIGLDSMSGLSVEDEMKRGVGHQYHFPPHARKISQSWRIHSKTLRRRRGTVIVLDHEKPTGIPGGTATGFYASARLRMVGKGPIREDPENPNSREIGYLSMVEVVKNRTGSRIIVPFKIYYRPNPLSRESDCWQFLWINEIAEKSGAYYNLRPYIEKSFYLKDWNELYHNHADLWPQILEDFYTKRYAQYCELRGIDPQKHMEDYLSSLENEPSEDEESQKEEPGDSQPDSV